MTQKGEVRRIVCPAPLDSGFRRNDGLGTGMGSPPDIMKARLICERAIS